MKWKISQLYNILVEIFKYKMKENQLKPTSKTEFLEFQNQRLKDQAQDMRELIKMNKVQIDILSKSINNAKMMEIIKNYRLMQDSNDKKFQVLQKNLQKCKYEVQLFDNIFKKLMLQQINNDMEIEQKALEELQKDRLESMQDVVKDLEQKVMLLERNQKNYDGITGFVERNKEIFNPTEQALQFKNREYELGAEIGLLKYYLDEEKSKQQNLLNVNGILRHKVVTLQAKLAMPNKNLGEILDKSLKRLMMYFIETQKRMLTGEESDSEGEEDLDLIAPELSTYFGDIEKRKKDHKVPAIDMLKIRGAMQSGNAKIKEELIKRNHLSKEEKIQRLQIQLEYTRRQLAKNLIDLREEISRRKYLEKLCEEVQSRNDVLIKSNEHLAKKIEKYVKQNKINHEKYLQGGQIQYENVNDLSITIVRLDNNNVEEPEKKGNQRKKHEGKINKPFQIFENPKEYKIHLELLAKDLYKNKKISNLDKLKKIENLENEEGDRPRFKRSTSNPFLYFNERREEIMDVNEHEVEDENRMRLEQTAFLPEFNMDKDEDLDDILI